MSGAIAAAAIAALAAGAQYQNTQNVAKKQDNNLAAQLRQQGQLQDEANAKTQQLINKTATSDVGAAKTSLLDQFMSELQSKNGNATGAQQSGNVSSAYTKAANDAALGVSQFGADRAGLVSAIDAPGLQRQGEATDLMRFGTDLGQIKSKSASDEFLANMRLRGIQPSPWLSAASAVGSAYAQSGGVRSGGASTGGSDAYSQGRTTSGGGGFNYNMPNY